jgi:hypothetical protein
MPYRRSRRANSVTTLSGLNGGLTSRHHEAAERFRQAMARSAAAARDEA